MPPAHPAAAASSSTAQSPRCMPAIVQCAPPEVPMRRIVFLLLACATLVFADGSVTVVIQEWSLPTPNERPHDPALGRDGALWYTAQLANKIGRLDPAT